MKLCNFRPLAFLALIVIACIGSCFVSYYLTLAVAIALVITLYFIRVPKSFKIAALVLFALALVSFILTTEYNPNPYYRTYDPNSGLRGTILEYVNWYLNLFLSQENADLLVSMMFGDTSGLGFVTRSNFTVAGLAHVLVVSGMNVVLLASVIFWILKICKVQKKHRLYILTPILLFYAYLCGWQYPILRATIMFLIVVFAKCFLHTADSISTLSLSAIIILLLFPYSLASASFLLSYFCMLGIVFFYDFFKRKLYVSSIAMYVSVTIGTFPLLVYYFGNIPVFGLLSSVILLPILSFSFYVGMFSVLTFVFGAVLWILEPLLLFVRDVTSAIVALPFSTIEINGSHSGIIFYLLGIIIASRFIFIKSNIKLPICLVLFTCYFISIMF